MEEQKEIVKENYNKMNLMKKKSQNLNKNLENSSTSTVNYHLPSPVLSVQDHFYSKIDEIFNSK